MRYYWLSMDKHWRYDVFDFPSFTMDRIVAAWPCSYDIKLALIFAMFFQHQEYLESISDSTLQQYMDMGKVWRCWYVYPPLLHEIASKSPDELHELCPELERENAFEARRSRPIVNHSITYNHEQTIWGLYHPSHMVMINKPKLGWFMIGITTLTNMFCWKIGKKTWTFTAVNLHG